MSSRSATSWYIIDSKYPGVKWINILHFPYLCWHLSYVVIGASLTDNLNWSLLGWTVLAFFLGMGIAAHCYDLMKGDPLKLEINPWLLTILAACALSGAVFIGYRQVVLGPVSDWLLIALPIGVIFAVGYGLEWKGMHGDYQFVAWWAIFPLLVGYFAQGVTWNNNLPTILLFCFLTALVQRLLSKRVRFLRREVGDVYLTESFDIPVFDKGKQWLLEPDEKALALMSFAMVLFAGSGLIWNIGLTS